MIHPYAVVDLTSAIGEGTRIWQGATVIRGAMIGDGCTIGACAIVDGATVGDSCSIGHGAQIHPGTEVGHEVFIGPGAIICNDPWPRVRKGDFDLDAILGGITIVRIEDGVGIGAGAIVLPGVTIGKLAMVAAGAVVGRDVPPDHLFKRSGDIVPIGRRQVSRMRAIREMPDYDKAKAAWAGC